MGRSLLDSDVEELLLLVLVLGPKQRYLKARDLLPRLLKPLDLFLRRFPLDQFKCYFRMYKLVFVRLDALIDEHQVF